MTKPIKKFEICVIFFMIPKKESRQFWEPLPSSWLPKPLIKARAEKLGHWLEPEQKSPKKWKLEICYLPALALKNIFGNRSQLSFLSTRSGSRNMKKKYANQTKRCVQVWFWNKIITNSHDWLIGSLLVIFLLRWRHVEIDLKSTCFNKAKSQTMINFWSS